MNAHTMMMTGYLRGSLTQASPGARGVEKLARNPCVRQAMTYAHLVDPAEVMRDVLKEDPREGISPFALAQGNSFEARLLRDGAARLLALYRADGRLSTGESGVANLDLMVAGSDDRTLRRRAGITQDLLRRKLRARGGVPNIIVHPVLSVPLAGRQEFIIPDILVAADADPMYRVGEIKSYADLGGLTEPAQLRGALRQATVGVVGLRAALARLKVEQAMTAALAPPRVDLVLRRRGFGGATLRPTDVDGEMATIVKALEELPALLAEGDAALAVLGPGVTLDHPATIDALPMNFRSDCREFCPFAMHCREQARSAGEVQTLGARVAAEIAPAGSTMRALELMNGATPRTEREVALQEQLRTAAAAWTQARGA